jgi:hypothetical protein
MAKTEPSDDKRLDALEAEVSELRDLITSVVQAVAAGHDLRQLPELAALFSPPLNDDPP